MFPKGKMKKKKVVFIEKKPHQSKTLPSKNFPEQYYLITTTPLYMEDIHSVSTKNTNKNSDPRLSIGDCKFT